MPDATEHHRDDRLQQAALWAANQLGSGPLKPSPVSGDASFRRYFRVTHEGRSYILMDAPPEQEDSAPFLDVASRLRGAGLNAPEIYHFDLGLGLGLLEDFGDLLYRELIDAESADRVVPPLLRLLGNMARRVDPAGLPPYDEAFLQEELDLYGEWYLGRHRGHRMDRAESADWQAACRLLIESATAQRQVFVHRDFHSCNLLQMPAGPGLIDFQDARHGPLNYDLVSLLWDRYVAWPRERLEGWMEDARELLEADCSPQAWIRSCDLMGLQRNLKIVGIFARLNYRDGKPGYLDMIPRFYGYLLDVSARYAGLAPLHSLLERHACVQ